ncbi:unnamed protein product (macronuclear) [Paramecium tetraurelia]|uniref:Uncharacterized protein n=1 Tax=Paramecium tetraurelia TaxID=5888 RepID=A0DIP8_PARTE|nr:uncharacterized protein GSPATT00017272001 [Paramecium tetraurelia]CAK82915.1 unnamed protein product [Paramecium tetraurelia]|eukprot:XP_001450312.1 hypothetical protein (macronuclear) [Paramecium tetraurelia strain d4-2]
MVQVKFIVLLICALTVTQAFEAEGTLLSMSLNEISNLNLGDVNCENTSQQQFVQLEQNLESWADIIDHKDDIQKDINTLKQLEVILLQVKKQTQKKQIAPQQLKQINQVVTKKIRSLVLPQTASKIGQAHCDEIERQLERLSSDNESERSECCDALLKLATFLIRQLSSINQQCHQNPVTVIKIKGQIKELHIIQGGCGGGQTIDIPMGGSDEKCDKPETPTKPADPTTPDTPTDEPVPDPGKEEETPAEETETETEETTTTPAEEELHEPAEEEESFEGGEKNNTTPVDLPEAGEEGEFWPEEEFNPEDGPQPEDEGVPEDKPKDGPKSRPHSKPRSRPSKPAAPQAGEEEEWLPEEEEDTPVEGDTPAEGDKPGRRSSRPRSRPSKPRSHPKSKHATPQGGEEEWLPEEEEDTPIDVDVDTPEEGTPGDRPHSKPSKGRSGPKSNSKSARPQAGEEEEWLPEEEEDTPAEGDNPGGGPNGPRSGPSKPRSRPTRPSGPRSRPSKPRSHPKSQHATPQAGEEEEWLPEEEEDTPIDVDVDTPEEGTPGDRPHSKPSKGRSGPKSNSKSARPQAGEEEEWLPEEACEEEGEEDGWVPGDIPKDKNGTSTIPDIPEGEEDVGEEGRQEDVGEEGGEEDVGEEGGETPADQTEESPDQPEEQEEKCQETVEITATNAADIMCALGQYLSQLAHGGSPSDSPNAKKVCFCLKYEPDNADPSLLQLTQKVSKKQRKRQDGMLKALIPNRRI